LVTRDAYEEWPKEPRPLTTGDTTISAFAYFSCLF
jgi:hypothetical protein